MLSLILAVCVGVCVCVCVSLPASVCPHDHLFQVRALHDVGELWFLVVYRKLCFCEPWQYTCSRQNGMNPLIVS